MLLDGAGLRPSSKGAKVTFRDGKPQVTDGRSPQLGGVLTGYGAPRTFDARYRFRARAVRSGRDMRTARSCNLPSSFSGVKPSAY